MNLNYDNQWEIFFLKKALRSFAFYSINPNVNDILFKRQYRSTLKRGIIYLST